MIINCNHSLRGLPERAKKSGENLEFPQLSSLISVEEGSITHTDYCFKYFWQIERDQDILCCEVQLWSGDWHGTLSQVDISQLLMNFIILSQQSSSFVQCEWDISGDQRPRAARETETCVQTSGCCPIFSSQLSFFSRDHQWFHNFLLHY